MAANSGEGSRPVVLVTGCSDGGIGHAMARAFAAAGCAVVATARKRGSMRDLEGDPRFLLLELDVRSDESARAAVADALREHGRIDVLVNNAGVHLVAPLAEVPMDSFHQVFDTNVYGAMRMIQAVIPHMMETRKGTIVNVGSITAMAPGPWAGVYSASKAALHALSDSLRVELRSFGINVMIVAPGGTKSNLGDKSSAKYDQMHEWKYYKKYEESLRARTDVSQGPGCTPSEELAKKVVALALKKNPPAWFAYGQFTAILTTLYYTPLWFRDYFYKLVMKCYCHGARVHLRRGRAQDPVPRCPSRARQCRLRRRQARPPPRARRRRRRRQEVLDPRLQERRRVHQPAMARWLTPRRLWVRPAGPGQGPGVPQVVPRGGADPRAVGHGRRAGHLRGAGVERHPVVRGRRRPGRHRALLLRLPARHAAAAHGVGRVQALGRLLQPGLAVRRVGHAVVPHRRELRQLHRRARVPRRQVLRPAQSRRDHQGRRLHPRHGEAGAAQAGGDQARPPRHARHAHLLLRGRAGQDAARRARSIIRHRHDVACTCTHRSNRPS